MRFRALVFVERIALLCLAIAAGGMTTPAQAQEQFTAQSNHPPIAIPDDDAQFAIESSIFVPADLIIGDLNVTVNIEHPAIRDLEIDLFAPFPSPLQGSERDG